MPGDDHDADQQCHEDDQVTYSLLAALHDRTRQRGVHDGERPLADRVESQLAFDGRVRAPHDPAGLRRGEQFRLFGGNTAFIEQREVHVELRIGADAGDFRRADAACKYQRACRRSTAIAVQDGVGGDHVGDAIDLHQPQRAFLVEHRAHDGSEAPDLRLYGIGRRMVITRVVGIVLERGDQRLVRVEQPDQVDVHFVETGLGEIFVLEFRVQRRHV